MKSDFSNVLWKCGGVTPDRGDGARFFTVGGRVGGAAHGRGHLKALTAAGMLVGLLMPPSRSSRSNSAAVLSNLMKAMIFRSHVSNGMQHPGARHEDQSGGWWAHSRGPPTIQACSTRDFTPGNTCPRMCTMLMYRTFNSKNTLALPFVVSFTYLSPSLSVSFLFDYVYWDSSYLHG